MAIPADCKGARFASPSHAECLCRAAPFRNPECCETERFGNRPDCIEADHIETACYIALMLSLTGDLEGAIGRALRSATAVRFDIATLEHLLLALLSEPSVAKILEANEVSIASLETCVRACIDEELKPLAITPREGNEAQPSAAFMRALHRAEREAASAGRPEVSGGEVIVSLFLERDSHAAFCLREHGLTRAKATALLAGRKA
jgi:ATP-dependent Clp protease ATP-binding subunit ClpA